MQTLLLLPLLALAIQCLCVKKTFHIRDNTTVGILTFLLFWILASATLSPFSEQSFEASTTLIYAIGLLYLIIVVLGSPHRSGYTKKIRRLHYFLAGFFILFLFISLQGWMIGVLRHAQEVQTINQTAGETILSYNVFDIRNERPLGHSNYTAGMAILMLPWLAMLGWTSSGKQRVAWSLASGLSLFLLFSSGSRGGLLGLTALIAGSISYLAIRHKVRKKNLLLIIGLATLIVVGIGVSNKRIKDLVVHFATHRTLNEGDTQRMNMLKAGWEMGMDRFITGYGPGTTPRVYPQYRSELSGGVETALQLHNTPIQIWADLGIFGITSCILLLGILSRRIQKVLPSIPETFSKNSQGTLFAAGFSLFGYTVFSLTDYQLDIPIFAALIAINSAVILSLTNFEKTKARNLPRSYMIGATIFAVLAILLVHLSPSIRARSFFSTSINYLEQANFSSFLDYAKKSMTMAPWEPYYLNATASAFLFGSRQTESSPKRDNLITQAINLLTRSLRLDPDQELCHFNLGWLYLNRDAALAENHFIKAAHLVPDKGGVYLGYGLSLLHQQKAEKAHHVLALETINDPRFITSPIWDTPLLKPHRAEMLRCATEIISTWKNSGGVSLPTQKKLTYTQAILLWWAEKDFQIETLITNGNSFSKPFFQFLQNPGSLQLETIPSQPWQSLYLAWKDPSKHSQTLHQALLSRYRLNLFPERENAYKKLLEDFRNSSFLDLIKAPAGNELPLMKTYQRKRIAYGILMRNMDGPTPVDAYVVQENGIVADFLAPIFPSKGHLPNTLFTNYLSNLSVTQNKK